jgi:ATP-dependent Clp protease ATP-binding subunit ClpC
MYEKYTEKARRVIFFARYEVSQSGAKSIEPEHLLLGLLREDKVLVSLFIVDSSSRVEIRKQIEERAERGTKFSTSVEVPLSDDSKKVLAYAADESAHLGYSHIETEHLLAGLLRKNSLAQKALMENGVKLADVRRYLKARGGK